MIEQLPFALPTDVSYDEADFIVTPANAEAHGQLLVSIGPMAASPSPVTILVGEKGAGKTHLANIWLVMNDARQIEIAEPLEGLDTAAAYLIEDVDCDPFTPEREEWFFHFVNRIKSDGGRLLLTARTIPGAWTLSLPDWRSRAVSYPLLRLELPDDETLTIVLAKMSADRQLNLEPDLIEYMVRRMERSYSAASTILAAIDRKSLATRRAITKRMAGEIIDELFGAFKDN